MDIIIVILLISSTCTTSSSKAKEFLSKTSNQHNVELFVFRKRNMKILEQFQRTFKKKIENRKKVMEECPICFVHKKRRNTVYPLVNVTLLYSTETMEIVINSSPLCSTLHPSLHSPALCLTFNRLNLSLPPSILLRTASRQTLHFPF